MKEREAMSDDGRLRQSVVLHEALGAEEHESEGVVVALGGWDVRGSSFWDWPGRSGGIPLPTWTPYTEIPCAARRWWSATDFCMSTSACELNFLLWVLSTLLQLEQLSAVGGGSF